jgi:hypothetical protein
MCQSAEECRPFLVLGHILDQLIDFRDFRELGFRVLVF